MLIPEISPLSRYLVHHANPELNPSEQEYLSLIINCLFVDLDAGDSCSDLTTISQRIAQKPAQILELLRKSNLVSEYSQVPDALRVTPLSIVRTESETLVYISKYFYYELSIAMAVNTLLTDNQQSNPVGDDILAAPFLQLSHLSQSENLPNPEQLAAIHKSITNRFSIITGGPGTGKTTTVAMLLWLIYQIYGRDLKVKICAPTGKAALRVRSSLEGSIKRLQGNPDFASSCDVFNELLAQTGNFVTLHKLLGYQAQSIYFKHNQKNPLDVEVLIIDESSMVGLPLFSKLLSAVNPSQLKHIIFLGDKNQLSSVEEGYVLASLVKIQQAKFGVSDEYDLLSVPTYETIASELITSNRNQGEIAQLALAILRQNHQEVKKLFRIAQQIKLYAPSLKLILATLLQRGSNTLLNYMDYVQQLPANGIDCDKLFKYFSAQSVLCLTNGGVMGSENLNLQIERKIRQHYAISDLWYSGRPVIILQNDYSLELFNGDVGICVVREDKISVIFENGREFIPEVLPEHRLAYAITIHKSQGSEYQQVSIVLPELNQDAAGDNLLTRELIYTAVTRAKESVTLFSHEDTIFRAIARQTSRNSGLSYLLRKVLQ